MVTHTTTKNSVHDLSMPITGSLIMHKYDGQQEEIKRLFPACVVLHSRLFSVGADRKGVGRNKYSACLRVPPVWAWRAQSVQDCSNTFLFQKIRGKGLFSMLFSIFSSKPRNKCRVASRSKRPAEFYAIHHAYSSSKSVRAACDHK